MTEPLDESTGLSRRSALKRIGAGAAIAWSAPAMMSVARPVSAGSAQPCGPCPQPAACCDPAFGAAPAACGGSTIEPCSDPFNLSLCFCGPGPDGSCVCAQNNFGTGGDCTGPGQCPPGEVCASVCGGTFCLTACGAGAGGAAAGGSSPLKP
jgi:hypothetical protein